jgi:hypothetical protein
MASLMPPVSLATGSPLCWARLVTALPAARAQIAFLPRGLRRWPSLSARRYLTWGAPSFSPAFGERVGTTVVTVVTA